MIHARPWAMRPQNPPTRDPRNPLRPRGLRCRQCGGEPFLARREPHPTKGVAAELRTYECPACGLPDRITVPASAA